MTDHAVLCLPLFAQQFVFMGVLISSFNKDMNAFKTGPSFKKINKLNYETMKLFPSVF